MDQNKELDKKIANLEIEKKN